MPYRGYIEKLVEDRMSGWATDGDGEPCELRLLVNGIEATRLKSDGSRHDLAKVGQSKGLGGFSADLSTFLEVGENTCHLHFADGTHIGGSPFRRVKVPPPSARQSFAGHLETYRAEDIRGWAVTDGGHPCMVRVEINGAEYLSQLSDGPRHDLAARGLSAGLGGFRFDLAAHLVPGENRLSFLYPDGSQVAGSPVVIVAGSPAGAFSSDDEHPVRGTAQDAPRPTGATPKAEAPIAPLQVRVSGVHEEQLGDAMDKPMVTPNRHRAAKGKATMPPLSVLDELSLDDLSLAVASGLISVPEPQTPPPSSRVDDPSEGLPQNSEPQSADRPKNWLFKLSRKFFRGGANA